MQAFNILNATERPWKTNPRVFNILGFLVLKRHIFCAQHNLKAKVYRQTHTHTSPFLCLDILVREHQWNIWPCNNNRSFNNSACGNAYTATLCWGDGAKKRNLQFLHAETTCFSLPKPTEKSDCVSKSHYYKN